MKNTLQILQFLSYSSNAEINKLSSWSNVKNEALNGLNRAVRLLWNSKEWNFRREIKKYTLSSGKNTISAGKYLIAKDGVRINNTPIRYDSEIPFYEPQTGTPTSYYVNRKGKITFYPTPDKKYILTLDVFNTLPVIDSKENPKEEFTEESDTLNISERLEKLFIDCLNYLTNEILNGDPTDEEYQEHSLRCSEVYKMLEKADQSSIDNDKSKGFLMPWQK